MIRKRRGILSGVGVIVVAVIVTVSLLSVVLNSSCQSRFQDNLQVYPGAVVVNQESVFLGVQRVVYHSDDTAAAIDRWYQSRQAAQMRDAVTSGSFSGVKQQEPNWWIDTDTARGGSLITVSATCP